MPRACTNDIGCGLPGGGRDLPRVQLATLLQSWCQWWPGWKLEALLENWLVVMACSVAFIGWCGVALADVVLPAAVAAVRVATIAEATAAGDASGRMQCGRFVLQMGLGLCTMSVASCSAAGGSPMVGMRAFVKDTATTIPP